MRVLMTADAVGGVWTYAMELAHGLAPYGVEIVLATMGVRPDANQRRQALECENVELVESEYKLEWMQEPWDDVDHAGEWLLSLAQTRAPDVIHLNGYAHASLPWSAPVIVVAHSCVRSWWTSVKGGAPCDVPAEWDEYTRRVRAGLAAATMVVAPTHAMAASLHTHYGPLRPVEVIPNGRLVPSSPASMSRKESVVLAAGRVWDEAKNLMTLARVAPTLHWPVAIVGDTSSPQGGTVEASSGSSRVRWLGRLSASELAAWMGRAWIYALPARYEPFGLSALEAALSGCALVLGDIPSLREIWGRDGGEGSEDAAVFVSPDDASGLIEAINTLAEDPARRRTLGEAARVRGLALSREQMAARYVSTYDATRGARSRLRETACAS